MRNLEIFRRLFRTKTSNWRKQRLETLSKEIEDSRELTNVSDVGMSQTTNRLIKIETELRALMDVMEEFKEIVARRAPRGSYMYVATSQRSL